MKTGLNLTLANGASVKARANLDGGIYVLIEENGHTVLINMTKQKAGMLKDALSKIDLVTDL